MFVELMWSDCGSKVTLIRTGDHDGQLFCGLASARDPRHGMVA
jgi:hypothetical protein